MGPIIWFLGIQVLHNWANKKLWLLQDSYINKIANQFHLTHKQPGKHLFTPITIDGLALFKGQSTDAKWYKYMQKVSSLLYITIITHPDTAKAANRLAEFTINPGPNHIKAVNHTIFYLFHTHYYTLQYLALSRNSEEVFICTSDAAYSDLIS